MNVVDELISCSIKAPEDNDCEHQHGVPLVILERGILFHVDPSLGRNVSSLPKEILDSHLVTLVG